MNYKCFFGYKRKKIIFDNTEFNFPENGITVICGHNGAGKTTLLKCISGIIPSPQKLDDCWYVGPQGALIQNFTLREHLKLLESDGKSSDLINYFSLSEITDKHISKLSTGQIMLCSIIVAIASNKKIILLDEPFGPLDPVNSSLLADLLKRCGKTIIMSSHDLYIAGEISDKIYFIKKGEITFEHEERPMDIEYLKRNYQDYA